MIFFSAGGQISFTCVPTQFIFGGGQFNGLMGPQFVFMVRASQTAMHTTLRLCVSFQEQFQKETYLETSSLKAMG